MVSVADVKSFLVRRAFDNQTGFNFDAQMTVDALSVISAVSHMTGSFAANVAESVMSGKRISEKQAFVIARAAVENNKLTSIQYI